jgi:hypothetical protein
MYISFRIKTNTNIMGSVIRNTISSENFPDTFLFSKIRQISTHKHFKNVLYVL